MIQAISAVNSCYPIFYHPRSQSLSMNPTQQSQTVGAAGTVVLRRGADPNTPIQPIQPVKPVNPDASAPILSAAPSWAEKYAAEQAVRLRIQYADPAQSAKEGRCETCEKRKYQDGSDDPSVSFQMPTRIDPDMAASAVRSHEMEHVFHEQAQAQQENRKVISQSVSLHTGICPECGSVYISGGTTRTVTKADSAAEDFQKDNSQPEDLKAAK